MKAMTSKNVEKLLRVSIPKWAPSKGIKRFNKIYDSHKRLPQHQQSNRRAVLWQH